MNHVVFAVLMGAASAASANIANGSFEAPVIGPGATTAYGNGSTAITGWTVIGDNVQLVDSTYLVPEYTLNASDGRQWVDLTGTNEGFGKGLTTTFAGVAGQTYQLTFDLGRLLDRTPATVQVVVDGVSSTFTNSGPGSGKVMDWKPFSLSFTSDGSTTLSFLGSSANDGNSTLIGLDNVAVVPEPSTWAMLLAGFGVVGWVAARRKLS